MTVHTINGYTLIPVHPNWKTPIEWRRAWQTSIREAVTGSEDRQLMKPSPGWVYEFNADGLTLEDTSYFADCIRSALKSGKAAIPAWGFGDRISNGLLDLDLITLTAPIYRWASGDYAFFQREGGDFQYRLVNGTAMCGRQISLTSNLSSGYEAGLHVWPLIFGHLKVRRSEAASDWILSSRFVFETDNSRLRAVPNPPCNPNLSEAFGFLQLSWAISGGDWDWIEVERNVDGGSYEVVAVLEPTATNYTDQPENGHTYCYRARSHNCVGYSAYTTAQCHNLASGGASMPQLDSAYLWLAADSISGLSDTDPVPSWVNDGTQAQPATQGDSGEQPIYRTNQINSLPAVRFESNDFMNLYPGFDDMSQGFTCIMVIKLNELNAHPARWILGLATNPTDGLNPLDFIWIRQSSALTDEGWVEWGEYTVPIIPGVTLQNMLPEDTWVIRVVGTDGANVYQWHQNTLEDQIYVGRLPVSTTRYHCHVGAASNPVSVNGNEFDLAELIFFDKFLSQSDRENWVNSLKTKYAL